MGAVLSTGDTGFANTPRGICPVTLIAFRTLAGSVARKLAVFAEATPPTADANITWVTS